MKASLRKKVAVDAQEVWNELKEKDEIFPYRRCKIAVLAMSSRGYEIILGTARLDNYCNMGVMYEFWHYWNRDPDTQESFDITAGQFNIHLSSKKKLSPIEIWQGSNHPIYKEVTTGLKPHQVL